MNSLDLSNLDSLQEKGQGPVTIFNQQVIETLNFYTHIKDELEKFNDGNHIFITHQTDEQGANNILKSSYFSETGLNGTSLIANLETIMNAIFCLDNDVSINGFQKHRSSNSLVIIIIRKDEFRNARNLADVDNQLVDYVGEDISKFGAPNRCVFGYVRGVSLNKNNNFTGNIVESRDGEINIKI